MVDELHDGNLALDASMHGGLVGQRGFGDDLDGDLLIGLAMASKFDTACEGRCSMRYMVLSENLELRTLSRSSDSME